MFISKLIEFARERERFIIKSFVSMNTDKNFKTEKFQLKKVLKESFF